MPIGFIISFFVVIMVFVVRITIPTSRAGFFVFPVPIMFVMLIFVIKLFIFILLVLFGVFVFMITFFIEVLAIMFAIITTSSIITLFIMVFICIIPIFVICKDYFI